MSRWEAGALAGCISLVFNLCLFAGFRRSERFFNAFLIFSLVVGLPVLTLLIFGSMALGMRDLWRMTQ